MGGRRKVIPGGLERASSAIRRAGHKDRASCVMIHGIDDCEPAPLARPLRHGD